MCFTVECGVFRLADVAAAAAAAGASAAAGVAGPRPKAEPKLGEGPELRSKL